MMNFKKWLCLVLATFMVAGAAVAFTGCATTNEVPSDTTSPAQTNPGTEEETIEEDHRFDNVNYGGRDFRIYTSTNVAYIGMGNSNPLIEGTGKTDSNSVNNAVYERNVMVEEQLGVKMVYTHVDLPYSSVTGDIRTIVSAGDDLYDLVINDIYPFAELTVEGAFINTLDESCVFDFDRNYWYKDYMADLRLMNGYQYMLAGDYFIDIIRSAHLLLLNKNLYLDYYKRDADEIYDCVSNFEWTYDKMNEIITNMYVDTNADGQKNKGDQYGFIALEYWGSSIGFSVSGNPPFITRDEDGIPAVTLNEGDRSNQLAAAMTSVFNNDSTSISMTPEAELLTAFVQNECLILDYQRLGSLENPELRNMESGVAVLPYPMLHASDKKYVTATHDTTELGAILRTSDPKNLEFISTVIEVLNRETANILIPEYYKKGLQVKYVDDSKAALMIDIIHDNFDNSFVLAYNYTLGSRMLQSFSEAMQNKREFSAVYEPSKRSVNHSLEQKIKMWQKKNNIH